MKEIDKVYMERNLLACALAQVTNYPSGWHDDEDLGVYWVVVWIETPMGQVSWHVPREMAENLGPVRREVEYDGYDADVKNDRLASWAEEGCWS